MAARIQGLQYDSPLAFTAHQRMVIQFGAPLIAAMVRLLVGTCEQNVRRRASWEHLQETPGGTIVALWHESAVMAAHHYRNAGVYTLASYSFDAEWAARALRHLGILSVRGSSSCGGSQALRDLALALGGTGTVMLTMDGPVGPRRVAKPGAAILAARTGASIIPHAFAVRKAWRLRSWDRLAVPKPFACIVSMYGPAILPPANTGAAAVEETRLRVEAGLNRIQRQLDAELEIECADAQSEASALSPGSSNR